MIKEGDRVSISAVHTSEVSQQYGGQLAKVIATPTSALGGTLYTVQMEGGQELQVERDELIPEPPE